METRLLLVVAAFFAVGAALILIPAPGVARKRLWLKYGVYAGLVFGTLAVAHLGRWAIGLLLALIALRAARELDLAQAAAMSRPQRLVITGGLFIALGHLLLGAPSSWFGYFSGALLLVAATDSFSQLTGRILGRHKLCPRLSPAKTVEGLIGGVVAALVMSTALAFLYPQWTTPRRVTLALATALAAVAGDLVFSAIKRRSGINDFAGILPGHGGVLDRFDSLIVAAPVHVWARILLAP